jgi:acetyltransferase-like isoleucine patch superfamily enzyme
MPDRMRILLSYLRYDLLLWLAWFLTNWWPDNGPVLRARGFLYSLCIGRRGKGFTAARDVTIVSPAGLRLGQDVYFAKGTWVNAFGGVEIEDEVMLGPYVVISSTTHGFRDGSVYRGGTHPAAVKIGRGSWLAAHVAVAAGVTIGRGALIGANAVVTDDVPDNVLAGGVPARVIGPREDRPSEIRGRGDL